jgi:iron uptake system component EfeO
VWRFAGDFRCFGGNAMSRLLTAVGTAAVGAVLFGAVACSDDGAKVRVDQTAAAGAGSGSGSLNETELGGVAKTKQLQAAVASYRSYVLGEVAKLRTATTAFTDAVRSGDVSKATELYAPSRYSYFTIAPVLDLVPGIPARVDALAGPGGWHRLERGLFVAGSTAGLVGVADGLDRDLGALETALAKAAITPKGMVAGVAAVLRGASTTGAAEPYSHTDLWDLAAKLDGAQAVFRTFTPVLQVKNSALTNSLLRGFGAVTATLTQDRAPSGAYKPYTAIPVPARQRLAAQLAAVGTDWAKVAAALGV